MRDFAQLFNDLDKTTKTLKKVAALNSYFSKTNYGRLGSYQASAYRNLLIEHY